ncbi:hypothetical protein ACFY78_21500 [Streptomyces olindensis]|uniref:effector-associated constant component EACC1 n=1 Tax=Streptomyces olindensis TaxID=358823 RepID=UPI0036CC8AAD
MDVRLRLPEDPDGGELKQLYDWLIRDRELRLHADIALCAEHGADEGVDDEDETSDTTMGDLVDILALALDTGFQMASLGIAILAWRRAQRPRSSVVVERDGTRMTLSAGADPEDVEAFLRALERLDGTSSYGPGDPDGADRHPDDQPPEGDRR